MKTNLKIFALALLSVVLTGFISANHKQASQNEPEPNRLLPEALRGIDYGIQGSHFPNPTYATFENGFYVWKHDTSLNATQEDLQLLEYGSYVFTDRGWFLRATYSPEEFAQTYNCKDALLKKGKTYTDPASWRRSETLFSGDALWFYIAKNKDGKIFKGTALVETEAKLVGQEGKPTARTIVFDPKKSTIKWTGYGEVGNYSLTGSVNLKSGSLEIVANKIVGGTIVMNLNTIAHSEKSLESHLKNEDFFDVKKYPTATLKITKTKNLANNEIEISGNLTIKKTTKPVVFVMAYDAGKYSGKMTIDRTDFGVQYGSKSFFDNLGDQAIKNGFDLNFVLR